MTRLRKIGRWIAERLKDLFYSPGNNTLDHGRVAVFGSFCLIVAALVHNIAIKAPIDLSPTGFLGGLAAVLAAAEIYLIRDRKARGEKP